MKTFSEYLASIGFFGNKSPEDWTFIREEYRKYYQREYNKTYSENFKRFNIRYTFSEYEVLQNSAKIYGVKTPTLVHNTSLAYLNSEVYLPEFKAVEELAYLVRKSSNNTNQLVKASHIEKRIDTYRLEQLVSEYNSIEQGFRELYAQPKIIYKPLELCS
jgi:hypothetical protein